MTQNAQLTSEAKRIIIEAPLYDTGALYNSCEVYTELANNRLTIKVKALYYLQYHLENVDFVGIFTSSTAFNRFMEAVYAPIVEQNVADMLNGKVVRDFTPTVNMVFEFIGEPV
jgi:hypothetical protein